MITPRLSISVVGVAISTALVPPLSTSAICAARGEYRLSLGALLLVVANIVGIQVASSAVMWLGGYRGGKQALPIRNGFKRNAMSVAVLLVLAVLLTFSLRRGIRNEVYEASVRKMLRAEGAQHKDAYLAEVRFQRNVVVAVFRTPEIFTPADVGVIETKLPIRKGENSVELRVRSIPVTVAS